VRRGEVDDGVLRYFGLRVRPLNASQNIAPTKLFCVNKYVPGCWRVAVCVLRMSCTLPLPRVRILVQHLDTGSCSPVEPANVMQYGLSCVSSNPADSALFLCRDVDKMNSDELLSLNGKTYVYVSSDSTVLERTQPKSQDVQELEEWQLFVGPEYHANARLWRMKQGRDPPKCPRQRCVFRNDDAIRDNMHSTVI